MKSDFKLFQDFRLAIVTLWLLAILQSESPFTTVYTLAFVLVPVLGLDVLVPVLGFDVFVSDVVEPALTLSFCPG